MIKFRQAAENDTPALIDIAHRVIQHNYASFLGSDVTAEFIGSGMADKEIHDGIHDCTVMVCDGKIAGFAITTDELLHLIMVDVPFQNVGYGSNLLQYVENKLFLEFDNITLQTFEDNKASVRFYIKNGWSIIGNEENFVANLKMLKLIKQRDAEENT